MKHILSIAMKDIRETLRDKMTFFFLLLMPVTFTLLFGFAFGGSSDAGDNRLPVALLDQDGTRGSAGLQTLIEQSTAIRVEAASASPEELEIAVMDGAWAAAVIVPAGYGASLESGQPMPLDVVYKSGSPEGFAAQGEVLTAARRAASAGMAALTAEQSTGLPFRNGFDRAVASWQEPPVTVQVVNLPAAEEESGPQMPFSHTSPAMMVQFALAGLTSAAQVIVRERKTHCLQRLLTTRASRPEIVLGHFTAIFLTILGQFVLLVAFGQLILKLDYLRQPLATLLMMVCTALFVAAVGLLIGALAKTNDQAIIFALVPMFVLSALGGAWMPLEFTGGAFRAVGQVTPVALAMEGFKNIIARGLAFESVMLPAGALAGYAALFLALAVWKFRSVER